MTIELISKNGKKSKSANLEEDMELLDRIPALAGDNVRWQVLQGGLTNRNYRVDTADRSFGIVMFCRLDDVYRVTGVDVVDDFMLVAVDDGNLAGITLDMFVAAVLIMIAAVNPERGKDGRSQRIVMKAYAEA